MACREAAKKWQRSPGNIFNRTPTDREIPFPLQKGSIIISISDLIRTAELCTQGQCNYTQSAFGSVP